MQKKVRRHREIRSGHRRVWHTLKGWNNPNILQASPVSRFTASDTSKGLSRIANQLALFSIGMHEELSLCPVCGYTISFPPRDNNICPCCGIEFGYDDVGVSHVELRNRWIADGHHWWSPNNPSPYGWSASIQLYRAFGFHPMRKQVSNQINDTWLYPKVLAQAVNYG